MVPRSQLLLVLIAASILDVPHKVFLIKNVLFPNTSNRIAVIYGNYKCINCAKKRHTWPTFLTIISHWRENPTRQNMTRTERSIVRGDTQQLTLIYDPDMCPHNLWGFISKLYTNTLYTEYKKSDLSTLKIKYEDVLWIMNMTISIILDKHNFCQHWKSEPSVKYFNFSDHLVDENEAGLYLDSIYTFPEGKF